MADKKNPMPKKPAVKRPNSKPVPMPTKPKPKPTPKVTGPAAIKEIQRQVSPSGVKKTESGAKKGLDKKYPGLYKNSK
jgi:hypothetical protein